MQMKKNIAAFVMLIIVVLTVFAPAAYAAPEDALQEAEVPDASSRPGKIMVKVPFLAQGYGDVEFFFPYSDTYFQSTSADFSRDIAKASLGLVTSAFRSSPASALDNQYEVYLKAAGFHDIHPFGYDQPTDADTLSGVIAHKKIGDFTLIAASPASQGYAKEWGGNMEIGSGIRHEGFEKAAQIMESQIAAYIEENNLEGNLKLWVTGFSRGGAVGNLVAADEFESGIFSDIFAYLFAVPRTTKEPVAYPGIFNICGKFDPVTQVPFQSWGYERYGIDLYTPSAETNSDFFNLFEEAMIVADTMVYDSFRFNPELDIQLHLVCEFMGELFPVSQEYVENMQDYTVEAMKNVSIDTVVPIIDSVFSQMTEFDARQEYSSEIFLDFLTYMASQRMGDTRGSYKIRDWAWDQRMGAYNYFSEHTPLIYISWIFSDTTDTELFGGPLETRRIYVNGDVNVEVWSHGKYVNGIDTKGTYIYKDFETWDEYDNDKNVFLFRNGKETLVCLPADDDYEVHYIMEKPGQFVFYDVVSSPQITFGSGEDVTLVNAGAGEYYVEYEGLVEKSEVNTISGDLHTVIRHPFIYSPTVIMENEINAEKHFTIEGLMRGVFAVFLIIVFVLLVCLLIAIIHRIRKKKHGPYSPLYVIIPHLIIFVVFVLTTRYLTYYLYMIKHTRIAGAAISMFVLLLLSLRGLIRNRNLKNLFITLGILAAGVINCMVYQGSNFLNPHWLQTVIYFVLMAALALLASFTFYIRKDSEGKHKKIKTAQVS